MKCKCVNLRQRRYITTPKGVEEILSFIQKMLFNSVLSLLSDEGDNSDYYHKTFWCNDCKKQFLLSCETYHGSGGSFGLKTNFKSEYISQIDHLCQKNRIKEMYRGQDIYNPKKEGEWVYFDCYFDAQKIKERFKLPNHVKYWECDGKSSGQESSFIDELTNDAILGNHPEYAMKKKLKLIK